MDPTVKIQLLFLLLLIGVLLFAFMIIIHTLGNISHIFDRLEDIVDKETLLRQERLTKEVRIREQAVKVESERRKRSEALLNVPLMKVELEEKPKKSSPKKKEG